MFYICVWEQQLTWSSNEEDPTDAAAVPPSVLREAVGEPTALHDDKEHKRAERHTSASHQDAHRGL